VKLNLYISKYPMILGSFDVYKLKFHWNLYNELSFKPVLLKLKNLEFGTDKGISDTFVITKIINKYCNKK